MTLKGQLDGFPVVITYRTDGFRFLDVKIKSAEVIFDWDQLNTLQHEQILRQLDTELPRVEDNF